MLEINPVDLQQDGVSSGAGFGFRILTSAPRFLHPFKFSHSNLSI